MLEETDRRLIADFESCSITPDGFGHRQHIRVAWGLLRENPITDVLPRFTRALKRFAEHAGAPDLYHETITWAFLFAINERIERMLALAPDHQWRDFEKTFPELFAGFREFLGAYYSRQRLDSSLARRHFLLPDRPGAGGAAKGESNA